MVKMICSHCRHISENQLIYHCPECGEPFELQFEARFPKEKIRSRKPTLWRYREAIPIERDEDIISFEEGFTPLLEFKIENRSIWVKQDHLFPSGSYKDRGSSVLISFIHSLKITHVVEDSSGNAGCSIAMYSSAAGISCTVFVPQNTSPAKLEQMRMLGAEIIKITGSRYETTLAAVEEAKNNYYASHVYNPYFMHGTKTLAFEIVEQMGWKVPDQIILPVGNGTLFLGVYMGFKEMHKAGVIEFIPKMIGIQAENCKPLVTAWEQKSEKPVPVIPQLTVAEGIAISQPIRGSQILRVVKETEGVLIAVTEEEILKNWREMALKGFFMELTSAVTFAGIHRYLQMEPSRQGSIVSIITSHGLKSVGHF